MTTLIRYLQSWQPETEADARALDGVDRVICFQADKVGEKQRTIAQNRLYWKWLSAMEKTQVEQHRGHTAEDWAERMKADSLAKIYERDDQGYAETMQALRELYRHDPATSLRLVRGVVRLTTTTRASVEQFSEYLTYIDRFCAREGIRLPADPSLEELAKVGRGGMKSK